MIDFNRWIYSKNIAAWLAKNASLNLEAQIDCICAAPHRTLEEKLEGIKELKSEHDGKALQDRIENIERVLHHSQSATIKYQYLYCIEVYYRGEKDGVSPRMIFRTAKAAKNGICYYIETVAAEEHLERKNWYGVVREFRISGFFPQVFLPEKNMIIRYDGEVVYVQNTAHWNRCSIYHTVDMGYFSDVKVPYPSGTIISIPENPYIPELKGVLVNRSEPDEEDFFDDPYNQWLIYPTSEHRNQTHGIGFVNLSAGYVPFGNNPDFTFPYMELIDVYEGDLKENETWLSEFSALIKADKNCIGKMLHDRDPKNCISLDEERFKYVRELAEK